MKTTSQVLLAYYLMRCGLIIEKFQTEDDDYRGVDKAEDSDISKDDANQPQPVRSLNVDDTKGRV